MSSVVISGDTSGSITLSSPAVAGSNTITLPAVTGTAVVSGQNSAITAGTAVASTSGTSISFTGIPSWVKRITVMYSGTSTNGTSGVIVQLGTVSGFETTSYISSGAYCGTSQYAVTTTVGLLATADTGSSVTMQGTQVISNITGNTWVSSNVVGRQDAYVFLGGGNKTLGGTLTQIRVTTINGTDTFDAGTINIFYE